MDNGLVNDELWRHLQHGIVAAIGEATKTYLTASYKETPLTKIIDSVIQKREPELRALIDDAVVAALSGDFREQLKEATARKIAKIVLSKSEGEIERQANNLRASPEFRAHLTLAITNAVKSMAASRNLPG